MNKWAVGGVALAAVAVAGVLGGSYVMGGPIEAGFQNAAVRASGDGLTVEVLRYERGWLHSTAETLWTYDSGNANEAVGDEEEDADDASSADAATPHESVQFKVTHRITHGPWAMGHAAQVDSDFLLTAGANPQLQAVLKDRPALQVRSNVGWGRSSSHSASAPPLQWTSEATTITWGGLQAQWQMPADLRGVQGQLQLPTLRMQDAAQGQLELTGASLQLDLQQPAGQPLLTGPWKLQLASLVHQPAAAEAGADEADKAHHKDERFAIQALQLDSRTTLQGDAAQMALNGTLQSLHIGGHQASDVVLEAALRNLDAAWLQQALSWRQDGSAAAAERLQQLTQQLPQVLARQPALDISRLSLRTPEGLSELGATLAYAGNGQQPQQLLQDLQASLRAQLPEPVLRDLLVQRARHGLLQLLEEEGRDDVDAADLEAAVQTNVTERLATLKTLGALQAEGPRWRSQLDMSQGQLRLNGQSLDAAASQQLLQALLQ